MTAILEVLPRSSHSVSIEGRINAYDGDVLYQRLSDKKAVERVFMIVVKR